MDPLTKVEAGLKGTGDKAIPLQSVHIRARLLDLAAQVFDSTLINLAAILLIISKHCFTSVIQCKPFDRIRRQLSRTHVVQYCTGPCTTAVNTSTETKLPSVVKLTSGLVL